MKYNFLLIGAAFLASNFLTGCSSNSIEDVDVEYIPVKLADEKRWGMMTPDGEILFSNEFENTPTPVFNGIFAVQEGKDDLWTLYQADKQPKPLADCEKLKSAGLFVLDDVAPITRKGKRISVINKDGEELFTLTPGKDKKEIVRADAFFADGMLRVENEDGKYGAYDKEGNFAVPCKYGKLSYFNEGLALARIDPKNGNGDPKFAIIDQEGNTVASLKSVESFYGIDYFKGGRFPVELKGERMAFVTKEGDVIKCPSKVRYVYDYNSDYYIYDDKDGGVGLMEFDDDGDEIVLRAKYLSLTPLNKKWSKFLAQMGDDDFRIIDRDGEVIKKLDYKSVIVYPFTNTIFACDASETYTIIDEDGEVINKKLEIKSLGFDMPSVRTDYKDFSTDSFDDEGYQEVAEPVDSIAVAEYYYPEEDIYYETPAEAPAEAPADYYDY